MKSFSIGNVRIKHPVILAPMEHVTNSIFRRVVKTFGASLMFTEFCSSDGLMLGKERLWDMVRFHDSERPMAVQIFGSNPRLMAECARKMEDLGADILDINCGCSVPKMQKSSSGAYLALDLPLLRKVMESVVKAVKIPVTIKVRKGWDDDSVSCLEIAAMAEELGFSAVTVHGRTSVQGYGGKADWGIIDAVSRQVGIPVIGNGDIRCAEDAFEKLKKTGVAGVMVGRGVMGNPWIFREIITFLENGVKPPPVSPEEKMSVALDHFRLACEELGQEQGVFQMRRHLLWYIRGLRNAALFRGKISTLTNPREIEKNIAAFFGAN